MTVNLSPFPSSYHLKPAVYLKKNHLEIPLQLPARNTLQLVEVANYTVRRRERWGPSQQMWR